MRNQLKISFSPKRFMLLLVTCLLFSSLFSLDLIAFASCNFQTNEAFQEEIKRIDNLIVNLKTPEEIRIEDTAKIQTIKNKNKDKILEQKLLEKIRNTTFINLKDTETAIEYTITDQKNQTIKGTANFHILFLYSDNTSGYSVDKYDFTFDSKTKDVIVTYVPEVLFEDKSPPSEIKISENEQKEIENKKKNQPAPQPKTLESVKQEAKINSRDRLKKQKDELKKSNCLGLKANAYAGGNYDRYIARDYAITYASNYNDDSKYNNAYYFNYNRSGLTQGGSDCANFASQIVYAGGIAKDYNNNSSNDRDWYFHWNYPSYGGRQPVASTTWIRVSDQMTHMYWRENTGVWFQFKYNQYSQFNNLSTGDFVFVDWTSDGVYDHVYIITDWTMVNGYREPRLSAHSSNRKNITYQEALAYAQGQGRALDKITFKGLGFNSYVW